MELRTPLPPPSFSHGVPLVTPPESSPGRPQTASAPWGAQLPGAGLPGDRHARVAAQRSFLDLRQQFVDAVGTLDDGYRTRWLLRQVSHAQDPVDLWLMRGTVFAGLQALGEVADRSINTLERALEQVFPDGGQMLPLPPLPR